MQTAKHSKPKVVVETESDRLWSRLERVSVLIDGETLGSIQCGQHRIFLVDLGSHNLQVKIGKKASEIITFRAIENDCLNFRCYVSGHFKKSIYLRALFRRQQSAPRFSSPNLPRFGRRYADMVPWHEVLQVSPQASFDEVTKSYLRLLREFQSEKLSDMNELDKEYALAQAKKISAAYADAKHFHANDIKG